MKTKEWHYVSASELKEGMFTRYGEVTKITSRGGAFVIARFGKFSQHVFRATSRVEIRAQ